MIIVDYAQEFSCKMSHRAIDWRALNRGVGHKAGMTLASNVARLSTPGERQAAIPARSSGTRYPPSPLGTQSNKRQFGCQRMSSRNQLLDFFAFGLFCPPTSL